MKFISALVLTLFLSVSCNHSEGESPSSESINWDLTSSESLRETFDANIRFVNFTREQQDKMEQAIEIIKLVVATDEFRDRILNHTYNGAKTFVDNGGYTNAQIYQMILEGAEKLQPSRNNTMDAEVELYYANTNVVGYTYANSKRIWVNTKYFNAYTAAGVAHNLFHEWMHKLGFVHSSSWTSSREYSVPYAIGYLVGEIGENFL